MGIFDGLLRRRGKQDVKERGVAKTSKTEGKEDFNWRIEAYHLDETFKKGGIAALVDALKHEQDFRRCADIAEVLIKYGLETVPLLIELVKERDWKLCGAILRTLQREAKFDKKLKQAIIPTIPDLVSLLGDPDYRIRCYGIGLLGEIGDETVIPALENLREQMNNKIRIEGRHTEYVITENAAGYTTDIKDSVNLEIEEALRKIKDKQVVNDK